MAVFEIPMKQFFVQNLNVLMMHGHILFIHDHACLPYLAKLFRSFEKKRPFYLLP